MALNWGERADAVEVAFEGGEEVVLVAFATAVDEGFAFLGGGVVEETGVDCLAWALNWGEGAEWDGARELEEKEEGE